MLARGADWLIKRAVSGTRHEFLDDAEAVLVARLRRITGADLRARVRALMPSPAWTSATTSSAADAAPNSVTHPPG